MVPNFCSLDSRKYFWSLLARWLNSSINTTGKAAIGKTVLALWQTRHPELDAASVSLLLLSYGGTREGNVRATDECRETFIEHGFCQRSQHMTARCRGWLPGWHRRVVTKLLIACPACAAKSL